MRAVRWVAATSFVACIACGGSGGGTTSPSSNSVHGLTINAALYNATVDKPITEAAILVDGVDQGNHFLDASGSGNVSFSAQVGVASAGVHRVALKVIQQRYASVTYATLGTVLASNSETGAIVRQSFPTTVTLKAGDQVEVSVNVP
jgi:hypothetical protein